MVLIKSGDTTLKHTCVTEKQPCFDEILSSVAFDKQAIFYHYKNIFDHVIAYE